jgi:hypothetical protein
MVLCVLSPRDCQFAGVIYFVVFHKVLTVSAMKKHVKVLQELQLQGNVKDCQISEQPQLYGLIEGFHGKCDGGDQQCPIHVL